MDEAAAPRKRDAGRTRQALLAAASDRFARDGYAATTVRDIAEQAGVNVALINRYFASKEGLFEACLNDVVERTTLSTDPLDLAEVGDVMSRHTSGVVPGVTPEGLMLLLRSSGDEATEATRIGFLRRFGERLATAAGWKPLMGDDETLLRAQLVLAAGLGIVVLRSSAGLEPITSAGPGRLRGPLDDLVRALLIHSD
jgi:AcrR family transcriptional regulator